MKDYGHNRESDTDFWLKQSRSIWNDITLTIEAKMASQLELTSEYYTEKRKKVQILQNQVSPSTSFSNIRNRLGLSQNESNERVRKELRRLVTKSYATQKALKLTRQDYIDWGIIPKQ